jgi:hypothetical protein
LLLFKKLLACFIRLSLILADSEILKVAFVILGETSSPTLRAKTVGLATATQAVFGIVMNFAIPYMVDPNEGNLKGKVGFVFGGLALMASIGSYFYCPELKGRTFNEINTMFEARVPPRKMGKYVIETSMNEVAK